MKHTKYRDFKELLYTKLRNPEVAITYLNEALKNEDKQAFLLALKDVIEARGDIAGFAQAAHLHRQNIYRMFSDEGNPTYSNLMAIFDAMNLKLELKLG